MQFLISHFREPAPLTPKIHRFISIQISKNIKILKNRTIGNQISRSNMTRKWLKTSAKITLHSLWLQVPWTNDNPGLSIITRRNINQKIKQNHLTYSFSLHDLMSWTVMKTRTEIPDELDDDEDQDRKRSSIPSFRMFTQVILSRYWHTNKKKLDIWEPKEAG